MPKLGWIHMTQEVATKQGGAVQLLTQLAGPTALTPPAMRDKINEIVNKLNEVITKLNAMNS